MQRVFDIVIVGAGIAGLAAATLLARAGHHVTVYERYERSKPIGSGLMIQPVGLAALGRMGLRERIETLGARIGGIHGVTDRGVTVFDLAYGELDPSFYAVAVHRAALQGTLWDAFAASGADFVPACEIAAIKEDGGRAALIGADGAVIAHADLALDASGSRSTLRAAVTDRMPRDFAYGAVWATIPDPGIAAGKLAQRYIAAHTMMGVLPVGRIAEGGARFAALFWSLRPEKYEAWHAGFEAWRAEAMRLWPELQPALAALSGPDEFTLARYGHMTVKRPFRGPLALIGDSAHCTSPQLGQGANHGLLDAVVLADALAATGDVGKALALYATERRRQTRFYQFASAALTPMFQADSRTLPWLRDLTFNRMKAVPYLKREMVRTLAGLKTGLFSSASPDQIAGLRRR
ncbi:FAD-dependent urate hydroxylase [Alphaproteobacteria bacterium SO-S41]|nr:FAD-dependent urate hydroxylase [Alphaproteobacteria bacterium SO-S41]